MQQNLKSCWCFWEFLSAWYFNFKIFSTVRTWRKMCRKIPWKDFMKEFVKKFNRKLPFGFTRFWKSGINLMLKKVVLKSKPERFSNVHAGCYQHKTFCKLSDLQSIYLSDVFHEVSYFQMHVKFTKTYQQDPNITDLKGRWRSPFTKFTYAPRILPMCYSLLRKLLRRVGAFFPIKFVYCAFSSLEAWITYFTMC
jgi:hypothetical protein